MFKIGPELPIDRRMAASSIARRVIRAVPRSLTLEPSTWAERQRWLLTILWGHAVLLGTVAVVVAWPSPVHGLVDVAVLVGLALAATFLPAKRVIRSVLTATGLLASSAVLVHVTGGMAEMHFHFFVMIGVIGLYQHWRPFVAAIAFVVGHHAVLAALDPEAVFGSSADGVHPLLLVAVHGTFVLLAAGVAIASWRIIEETGLRSLAAVEERERRFRSLIEHAADVVAILDTEGVIRYASPASARVLGYDESSIRGTSALTLVHPDDVASAAEAMVDALAGAGSASTSEFRLRHRDGTYRWVEATLTNLVNEPAVAGVVVNYRDVTDRRALVDQLEHEAFHDTLTGLANRTLLLHRAQQAIEQYAQGAGRAVLMYVDLDDFKTVNDGLGHEAGDELLRVVAARLQELVAPHDTVARLGGDEFAVLLEDVRDPAFSILVGSRVVDVVRTPVDIAGTVVTVGASVGIVVCDGSEDAGELLRNADLAMYRAKARGKGTTEVYEARMHTAVVERMAVKADLRRAIDSGELEPHYQPIVDLATEEVVGVEALVRWHHPDRGLISPAEFVPVAEESGLVVALGAYVLRRSCLDFARIRTELGDAAPRSLSVNLSARQVLSPGLVGIVSSVLQETGLPGECLTLEVTESLLLERLDDASAVLTALKSLDVRIALDDFGTGYSSLSYLERFPVDIVKIDRSFIAGLGTPGSSSSALVRAIVDLSQALGLVVTAEGIEDHDQLTELRRLGCSSGQGWLFGRPVDADALATELRDRRHTVPAAS